MKWEIELLEGVAIVRMRSNKVNKQNPDFFVDLREAFRRLERESEALDARTVEAVHSPASLRAQARALEALKARRA